MGFSTKDVNVGGNVFPVEIEHSLFTGGTDGVLSYTPEADGARIRWTLSLNLKPSLSGVTMPILATDESEAYNFFFFQILSTGLFQIGEFDGGAATPAFRCTSSDIFIDQTSHYHILLRFDSGRESADDRLVLEVNGRRVALAFEYAVPQNYASKVTSAAAHNMLGREAQSYYLAGYVSDVHLVDGQALSSGSFGRFSDRVSGLFVPAVYRGDHGANGFRLDFADGAKLGKDVSGNGNDLTVTGTVYQALDTPTDNFITLNPHVPVQNTGVHSSGNCIYSMTGTATSTSIPRGTLALPTKSGKFYIEGMITKDDNGSRRSFGFVKEPTTIAPDFGVNAASAGKYVRSDGINLFNVGFPLNTHFGIALDFDSGKGWMRDETGWIDATGAYTGNPETGENPTFDLSNVPGFLYLVLGPNSTSRVWAVLNNGRTSFWFAKPQGYNPVSTKHFADPEIIDSSTVADVVLREGTGEVTSVGSLKFAPDFVHIKNRDFNHWWQLYDSLRGPERFMSTDTTDADHADYPDGLTAFNADGYALGALPGCNEDDDSFVDFCLKAGVRQGFEIVRYTGNGAAGRTVPHNLGKAPTFMIVRRINGTSFWNVYHAALGATRYVHIEGSDVAVTSSLLWNDTEPTSTEFSVGTSSGVNGNGDEYIAYLFTDSDIFKAFSFTGNGSADGPFVHLGGKPLSIPFWKNSSAAIDWLNIDAVRSPANKVSQCLFPNLSNAENTSGVVSFHSGGFKPALATTTVNASGHLYVGLAIVEAAQKYTNAF